MRDRLSNNLVPPNSAPRAAPEHAATQNLGDTSAPPQRRLDFTWFNITEMLSLASCGFHSADLRNEFA